MGYSTGSAYNTTTILKDGSGQDTGYMGEKAFQEWLLYNRFAFTSCGSEVDHYDFIVHLKYRDITVDVKTKKRTVPYDHDLFDTHVNDTQMHFGCQLYVFASLHDDAVHFGGWIKKKKYWQDCERVKAGQKTSGGMVEKRDGGKMKHSALNDMESLKKIFKEIEVMQ